jgi:ubiquinone/menaquinone biosynthesis C-methylase UbiE
MHPCLVAAKEAGRTAKTGAAAKHRLALLDLDVDTSTELVMPDTSVGIAIDAAQQMRTAWDQIAPGYDRTNTVTQMRLGEIGVQRAHVRAGMRFLDVASGSGALSIPAARAGAHVVAIDQSPVMLELLTARSREAGLSIETRIMDGQALQFDDRSFDVAGSQFGVMLFPEMAKGIREMARVVVPGGHVLVTAYGDPHQIDFLDFFVRAVQSVREDFTGPPTDPAPLPFQLQDPSRLRNELITAGLQDVQVATVTESTEFRTGTELWEWIVWSNPIVELILAELSLSQAERKTVEQVLERLVRERAGGGESAVLTNPVNIGVGTKGK